MATKELLLFLVIVGKSIAAADRWNAVRVKDTESFSLRQSAISYNCPGVGAQGCLSCSSYPYCLSAGSTAYNITCPSNQVCENVDGTGRCLSYTNSGVTECKCGNTPYIDDYYELTGKRYLQCLVGSAPISRVCPNGEKFDFVKEQCSATALTPPTTCSQPGFFVLGCRQGYYCAFYGAVPRLLPPCGAEEVYDPVAFKCVPKAVVKVPNLSCHTGASGAFADTLECSAFYVCLAGSVQGSKYCCPTGQVFSPSLMVCTSDTSVVTCPVKHPCDTNSYTYICSSSSTITTSKAVNPAATTTPAPGSCVPPTCTTYGAYPDPCNCKQYYWCAGGKATVQKCPSQLFFDSKTRYCTKESDFTGCN